MYIDFTGDRLKIVDKTTAEERKVEMFVAILPCSHYTYCEAVRTQKKEDLIRACEDAIRFYGGAPCAIVPDNLKSVVTRSDRNEPVINPDFESFAEHYGCAVVPARVRHLRDKALVENAVKLMYRSAYVYLEGMVFHGSGMAQRSHPQVSGEVQGPQSAPSQGITQSTHSILLCGAVCGHCPRTAIR